LRTNATMEITAYVGCPIRCSYCPQDKLTGRDVMSLETFKLIDKLPDSVRIDLTGMSEFFCRENIHRKDMLRHLTSGRPVCIYTTLLDADMEGLEIMKDINIVEMVYHVPDVAMNDLFDKTRLAMAEVFFVKLKYKWDHAAFFARPVEGFAQLATKHMYLVSKQMHDRAGNQEIGRQCSGGPYCRLSQNNKYSRNVMMPDGSVILCCMDYEQKYKLGNLANGYDSLFTEEYAKIVEASKELDFICYKCINGSY